MTGRTIRHRSATKQRRCRGRVKLGLEPGTTADCGFHGRVDQITWDYLQHLRKGARMRRQRSNGNFSAANAYSSTTSSQPDARQYVLVVIPLLGEYA